MSKIYGTRNHGLLTLLASVALVSLLFSGATLARKEELPEVSKDGLHLVKDTKVAVAYAKPGATLDGYTKVKILDCFVTFKQNWQRDYNMNEVGLEGRISDKDAEAIKDRLAGEFKTVFSDELTKKGYEIVDDVGPDTLLLRPALINVDVAAPDTQRQMGFTVVRSAGEMTLYLELYDSATSTLLARVIDPRADDTTFAKGGNRVNNKAAADRILRHWADLLATHLGEVQGN